MLTDFLFIRIFYLALNPGMELHLMTQENVLKRLQMASVLIFEAEVGAGMVNSSLHFFIIMAIFCVFMTLYIWLGV